MSNPCLQLQSQSIHSGKESSLSDGVILDDYSEMELILEGQERKKRVEDSFAFFSLVNVGGEAEGVTIRNAKYPLENGTICRDYQYGVSNEVIPGKTAEIFLKKGSLLLIKDF